MEKAMTKDEISAATGYPLKRIDYIIRRCYKSVPAVDWLTDPVKGPKWKSKKLYLLSDYLKAEAIRAVAQPRGILKKERNTENFEPGEQVRKLSVAEKEKIAQRMTKQKAKAEEIARALKVDFKELCELTSIMIVTKSELQELLNYSSAFVAQVFRKHKAQLPKKGWAPSLKQPLYSFYDFKRLALAMDKATKARPGEQGTTIHKIRELRSKGCKVATISRFLGLDIVYVAKVVNSL